MEYAKCFDNLNLPTLFVNLPTLFVNNSKCFYTQNFFKKLDVDRSQILNTNVIPYIETGCLTTKMFNRLCFSVNYQFDLFEI